jgi:succinate dehydrogenase/fumarate reductase flavoprotein subunit
MQLCTTSNSEIHFFLSLLTKEAIPTDQAAPYLRRAEETDTEPVESACGEGLGRRIGIAGVDSAGEVRAKLLHGAHRTPEHALASAAVVGVRVEETGGVCGVATRD